MSKLEKLKQAAANATQKDWGKWFRVFAEEWPDGKTYQTVAASGPLHKMSNTHDNPVFADMDYLKTFSPDLVTALINELDLLRKWWDAEASCESRGWDVIWEARAATDKLLGKDTEQ